METTRSRDITTGTAGTRLRSLFCFFFAFVHEAGGDHVRDDGRPLLRVPPAERRDDAAGGGRRGGGGGGLRRHRSLAGWRGYGLGIGRSHRDAARRAVAVQV